MCLSLIIFKIKATKGGLKWEGKFVYIIAKDKYLDYLNEGPLRYLPKRFYKKLDNKIKPRIVCKYKKDDNLIGYGVGITTKNIVSDKEYIKRVTKALELINLKDINTIYSERFNNLNILDIIDFEENTNIKISDGTAIKVKLIPFVLKSILKIKKEYLSEKEILIISNDTKDIINLTLNLAKESKFITILSNNQNFFTSLEEKVLLDTGLVVHVIKNIKNINKYDIIINFKDILISKNKIKGKKIIFDLTRGRNKHIEFIRKDLFIANDFLLKNPKKVICDDKNFNFNNTIDTGLYNLLYGDVSLLSTHVLIRNNRYTIKEACDLFLNKGLLQSNFLKKP